MRRTTTALALLAVLLYPLSGAAEEAAPGGEVGTAQAGDAAAGGGAEAPAEAEGANEPEAAREGPTASEAAEVAEEADAAEAVEAEAAEEEEAEQEEEEEPNAFVEYARGVGTSALTGINGIVTAPADPVAAAIAPPKALAKAGHARFPLGFCAGLLQMLYRTLQGSVDLGLAVVPGMPIVSPVPRYKLVPGFTHEDE